MKKAINSAIEKQGGKSARFDYVTRARILKLSAYPLMGDNLKYFFKPEDTSGYRVVKLQPSCSIQ